MKLNSVEFFLMNNPVRAASQLWIETPMLIGPSGILTGVRILEIGCGRGVGIEILLSLGATQVVGFDLDPKMIDLPDASFDAVVDFGILHHVPDWGRRSKKLLAC